MNSGGLALVRREMQRKRIEKRRIAGRWESLAVQSYGKAAAGPRVD
jgi:hypothetical protein